MTLPPIPKDRDWSEATWRAGLDEAVRRNNEIVRESPQHHLNYFRELAEAATTAHATTLLDAGIVKPVVSEAEAVLRKAYAEYRKDMSDALWESPAAIAVTQAALDKARAGQ